MAKPQEKNQIDRDLEALYGNAKGVKTECPHCKKLVDLGGDLAEKARIMELRLKYEQIKQKGGPAGKPSFFDDEEEV
jgi:hypothetical protein